MMIGTRRHGSPKSGGFRCESRREEDGLRNCGRCAPCRLAAALADSAAWMARASRAAKGAFLAGLLARCRSVAVHEGIRDGLRATSGKDLTYARSKRPGSADDVTTTTTTAMMTTRWSRQPSGADMAETFSWFSRSPDWVKSSYVTRVLSLCDTGLLRVLANLNDVLLARQRRACLVRHGEAFNREVSHVSVPDCASSFRSEDRPHLELLRQASSVFGPVDLCGSKNDTKGPARLTSALPRRKGAWLGKEEACEDQGRDSEDPALTVLPCSSASMSGVSRHRDFIRCLPVHLAKMILGGRLVAIGSKDRIVRLLSVASKKEVVPVLRGHVGSVRTVLVCEDRDLVISAGYDLSIRCWSLKTSECVALLSGHTGTINCLDVHSYHLVSGAKDCKVKVWNLQKGKCLGHLKWKHAGPVQCVRIAALLVYSSCAKGLVKIWDVENASLLRVLDGHRSSVKCLFFDRWHLLSGDADGQVLAWSTHCKASKCLMTFTHPMEVRSLALAYLRVVTGCVDGQVRVFSFLTGDCLRVIKAGSKLNPILSVHFHGIKSSFCFSITTTAISTASVLVNTTSSLQLFQFVKVSWEHQSAAGAQPTEALTLSGVGAASRGSAPSRFPHDAVRAERMPLVGSPCRKVYDRGDAGSGRAELTHQARCLSTGRMRRARESQQEFLRPCSWSDQHSHRQSRAYLDLQPEFRTQPPSALSPGRPASCRAPESIWTHRLTSKAKELTKTETSVSASERAASQRIRKRGPHHRLTTDCILLRVNAIQQAHGGGGEAALNMELNAGLRDAWGSPPPPCRPPFPLTSPEPPHGAHKSAFRPPPPHLGQQNHRTGRTQPIAKDQNGANAFRTRAHSDTGVRRCHADGLPASQNQVGQYPHAKERPHTAVPERRTTRFATRAKSEPQLLQHSFTKAARKGLDRRVNFQTSHAPAQTSPAMDPLRERGGFRLLTDDQLKRYITLTQSHNKKELQRPQS
ncbi:unnamed protein product [Merluccius merluccius]